ncbi:hypothetical protein GCM10009740_35190 [Terrabacter terrae]|uniref:4'-phosphopantetheinyl transferase domain-containing protein n=1 Tax=Terrabacter terrae TaxID=318434 RepID=A0ABN2UNB9_9MICO
MTDLPSALVDADDVADAAAHAVVVWRAEVPRAVAPCDLETLSPPERLRVHTAGSPEVAVRRATAYALTRRAVGQVLAGRPADVGLDRTCPRCGQTHGRPRVERDAGLHLSVSHARPAGDGREAAPVVVVAVTRLAPVGIDLLFAAETAFAGFDAVARHPDDAASPDDESRARLWARKEAALKAIGTGLDIDPASFPAPCPGAVTGIGPDRVPVALADLELGGAAGLASSDPRGLVGAVALARDAPSVPVVMAPTASARVLVDRSGQVGHRSRVEPGGQEPANA